MKKKHTTIMLTAMLCLGIFFILYPLVSQYVNSKTSSKLINSYNKISEKISKEDIEKIFSDATKYNEKLYKLKKPLLQYRLLSNYSSLVNIDKNGVMGYITIDKIKVNVPIYHGTSKEVLNTGIGHLEGSSLPVGGVNTHSILTGHRGLPTNRLFTDLNKLELGDTFEITILNKLITYEVDSIKIVKPSDISKLQIKKGKDYVTLVTCTPYGINTHRLLVRGKRVENIDNKKIFISTEAFKINNWLVAIFIALPILIVLMTIVLFKPAKNKKRLEKYLIDNNLKSI